MRLVPAFLLISSGMLLTAGTPLKPANLCRTGESTLFSFRTKAGKTAAICQGAKGAYLVYRFGTAAKVELQYPASLDAHSWQKFTYWSYHRGGGAQNAGLEISQLKFQNNGVEYVLSDQTSVFYDARHEEATRRDVGIEVTAKGRTVSIEGNPDTAVSYLYSVKEGGKVKMEEF